VFRTSLSLSVSCFFLFCILNWNCTKIDNTGIGADLLPAVDNVNTFDTLINVIANNFDSSSANCFTIYPQDEHSLGYIGTNPLFGKTTSIIYTELKPTSFPFKFAANTAIDSIVLVLSYKKTFGDTTVPQKVNVYKIKDEFKPDSSSCKPYLYDMPVLGSAIYTPQQLNDSVQGFRELSSHQLRIKLDNTFGQSLLVQDTVSYKSDSLFKEFFKGFAIVPDTNFGGNALSYFSLADTNTRLSIYTKTTNTAVDTTVYNFRFTQLCASANYVVRNHTGAEIINHLEQPPAGDNEIYIQTTPGTYAQIKIPQLNALSNRIIHRATLTMDQVYSDNTYDNIFATPNILYLDMQDTSLIRNYKPIPCDFNTSSGTPDFSTFGGFRTVVKDPFGHNISRYTFNVSRYLQKIVTNRRINSTLRLRAPDNIINAKGYSDECGQGVPMLNYPINLPTFGQVRLGGGNNNSYRMKLHIVYSNL
jgi:hypothetical protein